MGKITSSLWSVRMKASSEGKTRRQVSRRKDVEGREIHVSGAEGLYAFSEIPGVVRGYIKRAMNHTRGLPDFVAFTIEKVKEEPLAIPLLPVSTIVRQSPHEARKVIRSLLSEAGLSRRVIERGIRIAAGNEVMRGASLIRSASGIRAEPDRLRGVRVSRLGIESSCERRLSRSLARNGINTSTVKEAVVLASKVASCDGVIAELCISDDPHYTTGYVASADLGYVRITKIKDSGSMSGGRIFFVEEKADVSLIVDYLEKMPVIAALPAREGASR